MKKISQENYQTLEKVKNEHYLNFIVKNHMLMQSNKQIRDEKNNNNIQKLFKAKSIFKKAKKSINNDEQLQKNVPKLFVGASEKKQSQSNKSSSLKYITFDMLMEIIKEKNKEIADELSRQRKSMGDLVYIFKDNNYKSLNKAQITKIKKQIHSKQLFPTKLPQIIKKKININSNTNAELIQKRPHRYINQAITQKNDKSERIIKIQNDKNHKVLDAYYKSQCYINLKEQSYYDIPQFRPPKHKFNKDLSKQKNKNSQINNKIKDEVQIAEEKIHQLNEYLLTNVKNIQPLKKKTILNNQDKQYQSENEGEIPIYMSQDKEKQQVNNDDHSQIVIYYEQSQTKEEDNDKLPVVKMKKQFSQQLSLQKSKNLAYFQKQIGSPNIYQRKMKKYRQFLFMMNLAHRKFDQLFLKEQNLQYKNQPKYKYYIGHGNNSLLIKGLLDKRFWWTQESDPKKANFVWTQLKMIPIYSYQKKSQPKDHSDKIQLIENILNKNTKKRLQKLETKAKVKMGVFKAPLPPNETKILTQTDKIYYEELTQGNSSKLEDFNKRLKYLPKNVLEKLQNDKFQSKIHNHFEFNYFFGNKKALFYNLKQYYELLGKNVFTIIPLTFHIKTGMSDPEYQNFVNEYKQNKQGKNIWIVKPGQLSNRGHGITIINSIYQLNNIIKKRERHSNGTQKTYIVQQYIEKPMLYKGRKFDIRHYMIITRLHGRMRAYWYGQGYIRTSSQEFSLEEIDNQLTHLTNDAIQKNADSYGKFQQANKLSYTDFQRYLDATFPEKKICFAEKIYKKMKEIAHNAFLASYMKIDPNAYLHNFEVFGLDFMIDSELNVWLIEVNTNPCLQINCPLLNKIIPTMLEHTFRLTLDVIFPPNSHYPNSQKHLAPDNPLSRLQFELIFDQGRDSKKLNDLYQNVKIVQINNIEEEDEVYENEGQYLIPYDQVD